MKQNNTSGCVTTKVIFSIVNAEIKTVSWRCKDIKNCNYCRGIEASTLSNAFRQSRGAIYEIKETQWNAFRQKMARESCDGYIRIPQENGMVIVYSSVEPNGEYTTLDRLSTEQLLANRLNDDVKGNVARTGVFAKEKVEETDSDDDDEIVELTIVLPMFRYKQSKKILPFDETVKEIRATAYRKSPYNKITKSNAEAHMQFVANYTIGGMLTESLYKVKEETRIEPLIYEVAKSVPVSNFANWISGADIQMIGGTGRFSDPVMDDIDRKLMDAGYVDFDWVGYCRKNDLIYDPSGYRKAQKELDGMNRKVFEDMGFTQ